MMWLALVLLLLGVGVAEAQIDIIRLNPSGVPGLVKQPSATPWTSNDLLCATANNEIGIGGTCNTLGGGGGGSGDITDVWSCTTGNCSALTAASGDIFDASAASSSIPCVQGTALPATCNEGECFRNLIAINGTETYICTASNTWVPIAHASAPYLTVGSDAWLTNERPISTGLGLTGTDLGAGVAYQIQFDYGQTLTTNTLAAGQCIFNSTQTGVMCEGATADGFETLLMFGDAASDVILTLPGSTDVIVGRNTSETLANKTLTSPVIASFVNAGHDHTNSAGGGQVNIVTSTSGTLTVARGGNGLTASVEDAVLVGSGTTTYQTKVIPDCDTSGNHLAYDQTTNVFTCTADTGAGGGIATLTGADGGSATGSTVTVGGSGIDVTGSGATLTLTNDPTELTNVTWSDGASAALSHTFNVSGAVDPVLIYGDNTVTLGTGNFVVNAGTIYGAATSSASGGFDGLTYIATGSPVGPNSAVIRATNTQAHTSSGAGTGSIVQGNSQSGWCDANTGCSQVYGAQNYAVNASHNAAADVSLAYGTWSRVFNNSIAGTITDAYAYYAEAASNSGGGITNRYAYYSSGTDPSSLGGPLQLRGSSSNTVTLSAGSSPATMTYTMPTAAPTTGYVLSSTSGGQLSWAAQSGGAPVGAQYIVAATDATLTAERALLAGDGLTSTDLGTAVGFQVKLDYSQNLTTNNVAANQCVFADTSGVLCEGTTDDTAQTLLQFPNPGVDLTISLPASSDTLVGRNTTDTLTGKTLTAPVMTGPQIAATEWTNANHAHTAANSGGQLNLVNATTGTLTLARGGTNQTSWTAGRCVQVNAGGTALESASAACGSGGSGIVTLTGADSGSATGSTVTVQGTGIDVTGSAATLTLTADETERTNVVWSNNASAAFSHTYDVSTGTDPVLIFQDNTVTVGTGNFVVNAGLMDTAVTSTATVASIQAAATHTITANPSTASSATYYGVRAIGITQAGAASGTSPRGVLGHGECDTINGCTSVLGLAAEANNTFNNVLADVGTAYGVWSRVTNTSANGTIDTAYAYYAESASVGLGGITNKYAYYSNGSDPSSLGGPLQLRGSTSGTITFNAGTAPTSQSYILPASGPATNGDVLSTTTGGTLYWAAPTGGITTLTSDGVGSATGSSVTIAGGSGITTASGGSTITIDFTPGEMNTVNWGNNSASSIQHAYSIIGANDPAFTFSDNLIDITTGTLQSIQTRTSSSGIQTGIYSLMTLQPGASTTAAARGIYGSGTSSGTQNFTTSTPLVGVDGLANHASTGTAGVIIGVRGAAAKNGGNVDYAIGVRADVAEVGTGQINNGVGVWIGDLTGDFGNAYGIYQEGAEGNSLGGDLTLRAGRLTADYTTTLTAANDTLLDVALIDGHTTGSPVFTAATIGITTSSGAGTSVGLIGADVSATSATSNSNLSLIAGKVVATRTGAGTLSDAAALDVQVTNTNATSQINNSYGLRVRDLCPSNTCTAQYAIKTEGSEGVYFSGPLSVGGVADATLPWAFRLKQQTNGVEIERLETTKGATTVNTFRYTYQDDVTTTNATTTVIWSATVPSSTTYLVEAHIVGREPAGSLNSAAYVLRCMTRRNGAGTVVDGTISGSTGQAAIDWAQENVTAWTVDCVASGNDVQVRVTGAAATSIAWNATIDVYQATS